MMSSIMQGFLQIPLYATGHVNLSHVHSDTTDGGRRKAVVAGQAQVIWGGVGREWAGSPPEVNSVWLEKRRSTEGAPRSQVSPAGLLVHSVLSGSHSSSSGKSVKCAVADDGD